MNSSTARRLALATAASFGLLASVPVPAAATEHLKRTSYSEKVYADSDGAVVHVHETFVDKKGRAHRRHTTYVATSDFAYVRECSCGSTRKYMR
jgi:hypothetical protein